jgi:hypothetical protein
MRKWIKNKTKFKKIYQEINGQINKTTETKFG